MVVLVLPERLTDSKDVVEACFRLIVVYKDKDNAWNN